MKRGFTLIELLVVTAIVMLIGALLSPALRRTREAGRLAMCANNLRQHGVAWYMYLDEHGDRFPEWADLANGTYANNKNWGGKRGSHLAYGLDANAADQRVLNRYLDIYTDADLGAAEVFHCPSDNKELAGFNDTVFDFYGTSYYANFWGDGGAGGQPIPDLLNGMKFSDIDAPHSKVLLVWETMTASGHGGEFPHVKMNVLFLDGHVKMHVYEDDFDYVCDGTHDTSRDVYKYPVE